MTLRWRTFSSLCVLSLALCRAIAGSHTAVTGTVDVSDSREKAVIRGHDYSGVVVWLEPIGSVREPEPKTPLRATMLQKNKKFIPHVLAVRRGTQVDFPNQDPIFHNAFSNFSG